MVSSNFRFKKKGYKHWVDVNWKYAARKFSGYTTIFLFKAYYHFALKKCPNLMKIFYRKLIASYCTSLIVIGC